MGSELLSELFERVANHLANRGVESEIALSPVASMEDVDTLQRRLGLGLPDSYTGFITSVANGFEASWSAADRVFASMGMTSIDSSIEGVFAMRDWRFYDEAAARDYGFPHVDDSELAFETNRRMHNWLPIHALGNGDNISIDLNPDRLGRVILDQHDWLDGGTGYNGSVLGEDLPSFLAAWAKVCFATPKSLWWKSVINEQGVDWQSDEFDDWFRLQAG